VERSCHERAATAAAVHHPSIACVITVAHIAQCQVGIGWGARLAPHPIARTIISARAGAYFSSMESAMPTPYESIGGDAGVRRLVDRFYDLVDTAPEAATIRKLHATSLKVAREKLYLYLTTWTGGPPVYTDRYGHPRLRARHLPFHIGRRERDEWLWCMNRSLDEHDMPAEVRDFLREKLHALADHMRNQPD